MNNSFKSPVSPVCDSDDKLYLNDSTQPVAAKIRSQTGIQDNMIYSPKHYQLNGLQCEAIDVIRSVLGPEAFKAHCKGTALKYLLRAGKKDDELQDIKKAIVYLKFFVGVSNGIDKE